MRSIRTRLLLSLLVGIGIAGSIAAFILHDVLRDQLVTEFDGTLKAKGRALGAHVERSGDWIEFGLPARALPEFEGGTEPEYFQVRLANGRTVARSATLGDADLPHRFDPNGKAASFDVELPDGRRGRGCGVVTAIREEADDDPPDGDEIAVASKFDSIATEVAIVVVAKSRSGLDAALANIRRWFLAAGGILATVLVIIVYLALRSGLRVLDRLSDEAASIDAHALDRRLEVDRQPAEVKGLTAALNGLLDRLEAAFGRERRMTANIAHELRTSVAELSLASEVADRWPEDPALTAALREAARDSSRRMKSIVEGLLHLARIEAGRETVSKESLDFSRLIDEMLDVAGETGSRRGLVVTRHHASARIASDAALLRLLAGNLIDNAVRHASAGGSIASHITMVAGGARWTLTNDAPISEARDVPVGEPFWREDASRTGRDHAGLGLAFVESISRILNGRIDVLAEDGRFTVAFEFAGIPNALPDAAALDNSFPNVPSSQEVPS